MLGHGARRLGSSAPNCHDDRADSDHAQQRGATRHDPGVDSAAAAGALRLRGIVVTQDSPRLNQGRRHIPRGRLAARAPVRTRLDAPALGRYLPQVEATVYFCCVEALQNAGKHAGQGASATVHVREKEGGLLFEVTDDGAGFDPDAGSWGAGLTNMTDRLGGIGGSLRIESSPGHGTRVAGTIPRATE
jgi:hypothetical protein